jgi:hypothetical protein
MDLSHDRPRNERDIQNGALLAVITESLTPELHIPYNRPTIYIHLLTIKNSYNELTGQVINVNGG